MIDTIDIGSLTKKIRLSKKLSLKDVAGDYLSVSFLSKFERGESEIFHRAPRRCERHRALLPSESI